MKQTVLTLAAALLVVSAVAGNDAGPSTPVLELPDSALADLAAGRYWHAARRLRAAGVADGEAAEVLVLARAESGWKNHAAVVELLADAAWLDDMAGGEGWYLLGRAYESAGRWDEARRAYARYPTANKSAAIPAEARRARAQARSGDHAAAQAALDGLGAGAEAVVSWLALELAEGVAQEGDTANLQAYLQRIVDGTARGAAWRLLPDAVLQAGDTARALPLFRAAVESNTGQRRASVGTQLGLLMRVQGDSAAARQLFLDALEDGSTATAGRAAGALMDDGDVDAALALRLARILDQAGDGRRALRAYDRAAGNDPAALPEWARLSRARLMGTVASRQEAAIEEHRAIRVSTEDPAIGARNLEIWAAVRRRQGRTGDVTTLQRWLLEEYPASDQAAVLLWDRGFSAEGRGEISSALATYATLIENGGGHVRATQARMRTGQIRLAQDRVPEAAAIFDGYLEAYPRGGRWEEASYWSAWTHQALGDSALARERITEIRRLEPLSYYAVMGADLLGEPYGVSVPAGAPAVYPGWLREGLRRLDQLDQAGLEQGADAEVKRMVARSEGDHSAMLTLAEELLDRGRTIDGINLGWALRREGVAYDRRLVEVVYPFPYRDLVLREAEEWGVDPILLAAIIRQESAFKADIVSHAGAVGLMQVMPPTGAQLARAHGPDGFQEQSLTTPEVNLHLGAAFLVDMSRRYDDDLPLVLSAYNAGPTRATRWRRYPEAADPLRFTERIPFDETRGYVKNVRRNLGLYRVLYGVE